MCLPTHSKQEHAADFTEIEHRTKGNVQNSWVFVFPTSDGETFKLFEPLIMWRWVKIHVLQPCKSHKATKRESDTWGYN
jgi:hypothetical protein